MKKHKLYNLELLVKAYQKDHPTMSHAEAEGEAIILRREIDRLNHSERRSQERFDRVIRLIGDSIEGTYWDEYPSVDPSD